MTDEINAPLEFDIVIIGGGLSGLLTAYLLKEYQLNVGIIDPHSFSDYVFSGVTELDGELETLSNLYTARQNLTLFSLHLEAQYRLAHIIEGLSDDCEFIRAPNLDLGGADLFKAGYILPLSGNLITYQSGTKVNREKLFNALYNEASKNGILLYENSYITEICFEQETAIIKACGNKKLSCKKIIFTDTKLSQLYFDEPKQSEPVCSIRATSHYQQVTGSLVNPEGNAAFINQEYYVVLEPQDKEDCPPVQTVRSNIPYIAIDDVYKDVLFNLTHDEILTTLIGALLLIEIVFTSRFNERFFV